MKSFKEFYEDTTGWRAASEKPKKKEGSTYFSKGPPGVGKPEPKRQQSSYFSKGPPGYNKPKTSPKPKTSIAKPSIAATKPKISNPSKPTSKPAPKPVSAAPKPAPSAAPKPASNMGATMGAANRANQRRSKIYGKGSSGTASPKPGSNMGATMGAANRANQKRSKLYRGSTGAPKPNTSKQRLQRFGSGGVKITVNHNYGRSGSSGGGGARKPAGRGSSFLGRLARSAVKHYAGKAFGTAGAAVAGAAYGRGRH